MRVQRVGQGRGSHVGALGVEHMWSNEAHFTHLEWSQINVGLTHGKEAFVGGRGVHAGTDCGMESR